MTPRYRIFVIFIALLTAALLLSGVALAQDDPAQAAIDTAAAHPAFAAGLDQYPGWTAETFDSGLSYDIWRVTFLDAQGDPFGFADVSPSRGRVYNYEADFAATDAQYQAAEPVVRAFLETHPDLIDLLGDPTAHEMYIDYEWMGRWGAWIENGADSFYVIVKFDGDTPDALNAPQIERFYFDIPEYEAWHDAMESQAVILAFAVDEIAAALQESDWFAEAERDADGHWAVAFRVDGVVTAQAIVDLDAAAVLSHSLQ